MTNEQTTPYEYLLEAFKNPNGECHQTLSYYAHASVGLIASDDKTKTYATLLRDNIWQCQMQLYDEGVKLDLGTCPMQFKGLKIHAASDSVSEANTFLFGYYDELRFLYEAQTLLKSSDSVIDVGANIGCHTMAYAKILSDGHVYAFEPNDLSVGRLLKNCELNNVENVTLFRELLSDKKIGLPFNDYNDNYNKGAGRVELGGKDIVMANTLDSHIDDFKGNVRLLKIDVEGHEIHVLAGAQQLLKTHKPYIFLEYNRDSWKISDLRKVIPFDYIVQKLPYTFFEELSEVKDTEDPEGFVNLLVRPKL